MTAKTNADAQAALGAVSKSFGAVSAAYEHVNIAVLYFKIFQLTGVRDPQISLYVRELEEKNLAIQSENPKSAFNEADRQRLIELIGALQRYEEKQIEGNKK